MSMDNFDERLLKAIQSGANVPDANDPELAEALAAHERLEGLFKILRQPARSPQGHEEPPVQPGSRLGEFTILRQLGAGGMGTVFLARQETLGRLVALKVCNLDTGVGQRFRERFVNEARAMAQLNHPHVAPVLLTGEQDGYLYLVMEYVPGPTLADLLAAVRSASADTTASAVVTKILASPEDRPSREGWSEGPATIDRGFRTWVVQTLAKVAEGLAAIHRAGIVHRDVKPANIVLNAAGEPKIVDFGLARVGATPTATASGDFVGTPAYTSPEQARGAVADISPASDVFSFGVMLFECLSLRLPFQGVSSAELLKSILADEAPLLRRVDKKAPWELEAIADKCLRKRQTDRYPSAAPLAEDLRNYLNLRPVSAKRATAVRRLGRQVRRRPWVAAFTAAILLAVILGGVIASNARQDFIRDRDAAIETRFRERIDRGDVTHFRATSAQRPTWLPDVINRTRQEAIDAYTEALNIHPETVWALVQRGRLYASQHDSLELALTDLQQANELAPGYASICGYLAGVLDELGRKDEAAQYRRRAERLYPKEAEDLYWLGNVTAAQKHDSAQAYKHYSACLLLEPDHYWARLERVLYGDNPQLALPVKTQARVEELRLAKTIRPDLPFASELIGWYASLTPGYNAADDETALKELQSATDKFGPDILRSHRMAGLLIERGDFQSAEQTLQAVLPDDPGGWTAAKLGSLKLRARQYKDAVEWLREAIRQGKTDAVTYGEYANAAIGLADPNTVETVYREGIKANPGDPNLHVDAATWYERQGRHEDAERLYRAACRISVSKGPADAWIAGYVESQYASYLERWNHVDEEIKVLREGIAKCDRVEGDSAGMKEQLGRAYIKTGMVGEARKLVEEERRKRPYGLAQARMLSNSLGLLGEYREALLVQRSAELSESVKDPTFLKGGELTLVDTSLMLTDRAEYIERARTRRALGGVLKENCYLNLAQWLQDEDEAIAIVNDGIKQYPRSFDLHSHLAVLLRRKGKSKVAQEAYDRALNLFFDDVRKAVAEGEHPYRGPLKGEAFDRSLRHSLPPVNFTAACFSYLAEDGRASAIPALQERLLAAMSPLRQQQDNGSSVRASDLRLMDRGITYLLRAQAETRAGRFAEAVASLEKCLEVPFGKQAPWVPKGMATCLLRLGRPDDAIEWYRRALVPNGWEPELVFNFLSAVATFRGPAGVSKELPGLVVPRIGVSVRRNATLSCFEAWRAMGADDAEGAREAAFDARPYVLLARGGGLSIAEGLPSVDEMTTWCVILEGVFKWLGNDEQAKAFSEQLAKMPASTVENARRILRLQHARPKGDSEKAKLDFDQPTRLGSKSPVASAPKGATPPHRPVGAVAEKYFLRATANLQESDFDKAIADCTEAIRLNPEYAEAYYCRGIAYQKKGDRDKAKPDLEQAKKLGYKPE